MTNLFNTFIYQPLLNLLVFLYEHVTIGSMGLSIILLTVLIRVILFPIFYKTAKHQKKIQVLQPHVKKIQETHKDDRAKQTQAMMELYREHGVNPFTPFGLLLLQLPVLIGLYIVFRDGFSEEALKWLYPFVPPPETFSNEFLGLSLTEPSLILTVVAAALQYVQARLAIVKTPKTGEPSAADRMGQNMAYISPILTLVVLYTLPAGIGLYWLTGIVFSIFQQIYINKHIMEDFSVVTREEGKKGKKS